MLPFASTKGIRTPSMISPVSGLIIVPDIPVTCVGGGICPIDINESNLFPPFFPFEICRYGVYVREMQPEFQFLDPAFLVIIQPGDGIFDKTNKFHFRAPEVFKK